MKGTEHPRDTLIRTWGCHIRKAGITEGADGWERWEYATEERLVRAIERWEALGYEVR